MRIAIPCAEDGSIFPHFGKTEKFEVYDTLNGEVKRRQQVFSNGQGHGANAYLLASMGTDAVICTGIGEGAMGALSDAGIKVYPGVSGSIDDAVNSLLRGELSEAEAPTCGHKHEEEHDCSRGCGACHACH